MDDLDMFGSDSEGDIFQESKKINTIIPYSIETFNTIFISLIKLKPTFKSTSIFNYIKLPETESPSITCSQNCKIKKIKEVIHHHKILILNTDNNYTNDINTFHQRLKTSKFENVTIKSWPYNVNNDKERYDIIIFLSSSPSSSLPFPNEANYPATFSLEYYKKQPEGSYSLPHIHELNCLWSILMPGGQLFCFDNEENLYKNSFDDFLWNTKTLTSTSINSTSNNLLHIKKRLCLCNESGAIYWTNNIERIEGERELIEKICVPVSTSEAETGYLSDSNRKLGVEIMKKYGVVIFPGLFDRENSKKWGEAAIKDMKVLLSTLKSKKKIDLFNLQEFDENNNKIFIDNYHELSMRESLRCDIRNIKELEKLHTELGAKCSEWPMYHPKDPYPHTICTKEDIKPSKNIRFHPSLLSVVHEVMNPPPEDEGDEEGNWGRWNFEGPGPQAPVSIRVGKPGCVISLPGCADQTIHADTSHLFVHQQLPSHYVNQFICTTNGSTSLMKFHHTSDIKNEEMSTHLIKEDKVEGYLRGFAVGSTAFVPGSHDLKLCSFIMNEEGGQDTLEKLLVRPQLSLGDALLFDCRILHFGLSNQTKEVLKEKIESTPSKFPDNSWHELEEEGWRPMLYVNLHHAWFHDPKNWNDAEKLL